MAALIEVFRSIRRGGHGSLSCPQCGARIGRSRGPLEGWILPIKYVCGKCGYSGFLALEEEDKHSVTSE